MGNSCDEHWQPVSRPLPLKRFHLQELIASTVPRAMPQMMVTNQPGLQMVGSSGELQTLFEKPLLDAGGVEFTLGSAEGTQK
jgi:hypothetical protein